MPAHTAAASALSLPDAAPLRHPAGWRWPRRQYCRHRRDPPLALSSTTAAASLTLRSRRLTICRCKACSTRCCRAASSVVRRCWPAASGNKAGKAGARLASGRLYRCASVCCASPCNRHSRHVHASTRLGRRHAAPAARRWRLARAQQRCRQQVIRPGLPCGNLPNRPADAAATPCSSPRNGARLNGFENLRLAPAVLQLTRSADLADFLQHCGHRRQLLVVIEQASQLHAEGAGATRRALQLVGQRTGSRLPIHPLVLQKTLVFRTITAACSAGRSREWPRQAGVHCGQPARFVAAGRGDPARALRMDDKPLWLGQNSEPQPTTRPATAARPPTARHAGEKTATKGHQPAAGGSGNSW